ncbi:hypothetical protein MKX01_002256 [Papaver californicum]|nr:hypothetical protein MKX01_002256 [Papaver californicum]
MAFLTSTQIIDAALRCDRPHSLSYKQDDLKWLIRQHFLSLLNNFPSLKPSIDTFTYDDGTTVKLLLATGYFPVSPNVHLAIWIHESYPFVAPFVFLSSASTSKTTHAFMEHPFAPLGPPRPRFIDSSLVSMMEALNFLYIVLHRDIIASTDKANGDIDSLSCLQAELVRREDILNIELGESRYERLCLKETVRDLAYEADVLMNWLKVNDHRNSHNYIAEDALKMHLKPTDLCTSLVRTLSREQFFLRAKIVKLRGSDMLYQLDDPSQFVRGNISALFSVIVQSKQSRK